ncbi:hypothetical protein OG455_38115 [Kitasatospora sp. NBC_01287]|uniref:hypothetical protein n=1 Tax=Kitasatospora sp. NBC_01287 TaxID=2903573 RepID=UPI00225352A9|nr:hypothetical protein [Kitasatospora sp. NBC_01287]MCX4751254.1 hypothetical protein [Kitasatospora sp. NBC_01287]
MATIAQITVTESDAKDGERTAPPLHFQLNTNPDPVRVSPSSGDPERADFVIVGSRRSLGSIDCRKIVLNVPTGPNSPDLTSDLTSGTPQISLPGWTATTSTTAKTITFTPASGHATIGRDQGVTLQLMGLRINTVVGSSPLRIDIEWAESGDDYWTTDSTTIDIGKFPADFYLRNFIAEDLIIDNGGSVKLNWEAGGASSLRLLYEAADVNVLRLSTFTVHDVRHSTVFYLRATVQVGTTTVERILSTTVTVRVPDLEVQNLKVRGTASFDAGASFAADTVFAGNATFRVGAEFEGSVHGQGATFTGTVQATQVRGALSANADSYLFQLKNTITAGSYQRALPSAGYLVLNNRGTGGTASLELKRYGTVMARATVGPGQSATFLANAETEFQLTSAGSPNHVLEWWSIGGIGL